MICLSYKSVSLLVLATASTLTHGFSFGDATAYLSKLKRTPAVVSLSGVGVDCPAVWASIAQELTASYLNTTTGECTDLARQAIRGGFHDCGAWNLSMGETGGCDGSLILAGELLRSENNGMQEVGAFLAALVEKFGVTTADMIQFSAASAIITCPLGPRVQTFVGRADSSVPAPEGLLPLPSQNATFLSDLFTAKGFDADELAALLGAHTASKQFFVDPAFAGEPQDDTPGIWDVDFYANTINPPPGVFVFQSDTVLSQDPIVGKEFQGFIGNQGKWNKKFAAAMTKMSLNGVPGGSLNLVDCTNSLPASTQFRMVRAAPINDRIS